MHAFESRGARLLFDPFSVRLTKVGRRERLVQAQRRTGGTAARSQPPGIEAEVLVNASRHCNLACRYCFVDRGRFRDGQADRPGLDPRLAARLIEALPRALPQLRHFCIHFYGGEPLLNLPAIRAAVEAAERSNRRFRFTVTTNGTVLDPEAFHLLKRGGFSVVLSIDGPPGIHDALRQTADGRPTHSTVLTFLRRLKREGIFVRGSSVVRRGWPLRSALEYLHSLPVDLIKAQAVRTPPDDPLALSPNERKAYIRDLKSLAGAVVDDIRKRRLPRDDRFNSRVLQVLSGIRRNSFCGAGRSVFGMDTDGTVLPCALLAGSGEADLGSIDGPGRWAQRGRDWAASHGPREECAACWALPLCGGGCPAMLSVCGDGECDLVRANCEAALGICGAFLDRPSDLMILAAAF